MGVDLLKGVYFMHLIGLWKKDVKLVYL
jgi:hypothetical protein